jgi:hypothetical protein
MVTAAQQTLPTTSADDATLVRYVIQPIEGATVEPSVPLPSTAGVSSSVSAATPPAPSTPFTGAGAGAGLNSVAALAAAAQEIDL